MSTKKKAAPVAPATAHSRIAASIDAEIAKVNAEIATLRTQLDFLKATKGSLLASAKKPATAPKGSGMSPARRKKISDAMKARHAAKNSTVAAVEANPAPATAEV